MQTITLDIDLFKEPKRHPTMESLRALDAAAQAHGMALLEVQRQTDCSGAKCFYLVVGKKGANV